MTIQEFQEKNPTWEDKEEATKGMSDEEVDELIAQAGIVQAKVFYSRLKKRNQIRRYTPRYNELAVKTLRYLSESKTDNVVFSPFSILMLLSIAADATDGETRQEIYNVIASDLPYEKYRDMISEMQRLFTEEVWDAENGYEKGSELVSANAVCVQKSIENSVNAEYEDHLARYHGILFASEDLVTDVNIWVKENTRGMIEQIVDDNMKDMKACLMNAIAFEAEWEEIYDEVDIYEDVFTDIDGNVHEVLMMDSTEFSYIENEEFTGFIKHYKGGNYSYMALLPKQGGKVAMDSVIEALNLSELFESAIYKTVYVTMPGFKYDFGKDFTDFCKKLGINTLFSPQADFTPLSSEWLKMEAIIHKAHIEVDRYGTKAAAVTMGEVECGNAFDFEEAKSVRLDRPFVYAIMHNDSRLPVFAGVLNRID